MFVHSVKAPTLAEVADKLQEAANVIRRGLNAGQYDHLPEAVRADAVAADKDPRYYDGMCAAATHLSNPPIVDNSVETVDNDPEPTPVVINAASIAQAAHNYETDSRGLPWDERIHSSSKEKNKDGSWRYKRGVDKNLLPQVEAELLAGRSPNQSTAPMPVIAPPPLPTIPVEIPKVFPQATVPTQAPVAQPVVNVMPVSTPVTPVQPAVVTSYEQQIPIPQSTKPTHSLQTFKDPANFAKVIAVLVTEKKIDQNYLNQLKTHFGVKEIFDLPKNDAAITEIFNSFVGYGFITKAD
jgi:hypothetical protein